MLADTRVSVTGNSFDDLGGTKIASFNAVVAKGSDEISLSMRILDDDLYDENIDTVTADRTEFEAFAFSLQDSMKG